ncbi:MAG: TerB family tellurite resistance protein [Pseudomonadota bacterium]
MTAAKDDAAPSEDAAAEETRLAFAALLVEAGGIDGDYADEEKALICGILASEFELSDSQAIALRETAEAAVNNANDHYGFSKAVKEGLSHAEKVNLVERLWEVVYADGVREAHEDYLIRRLIGLIYVSDQESGAARRRVEGRLGIQKN